MTLDTAVLADLAAKHVPFVCSCRGRRWVEDENWQGFDASHGPIPRTPGNGLIPCGFCNFAGWETNEYEIADPNCAADEQAWPCDAAALLAEVESLRKALRNLDTAATNYLNATEPKDYAVSALVNARREARAALVSEEGSRTR